MECYSKIFNKILAVENVTKGNPYTPPSLLKDPYSPSTFFLNYIINTVTTHCTSILLSGNPNKTNETQRKLFFFFFTVAVNTQVQPVRIRMGGGINKSVLEAYIVDVMCCRSESSLWTELSWGELSYHGLLSVRWAHME